MAGDGTIISSQSSKHPRPPWGLSSPAPACSQLSHRSPNCTKGESIGPAGQLLTGALFIQTLSKDRQAPEAVLRSRFGGTWPLGLQVAQLGVGLAFSLLRWLTSDRTLDSGLFCTAQTLWPCCQGWGLGRGTHGWELGDASPLCPFSCPPPPRHLPRAETVLPL